MRWTPRRAALGLAAFLGAAVPAGAHNFGIADAVVVLKTDGTYQIDLRADIDALALGPGADVDSALNATALQGMSAAELATSLERARGTLGRRVHVRFDGTEDQPRIEFPEPLAPLPDETPSALGTVARLIGRIPPGAAEFSFGASRAFGPISLTVFEQATASGSRHTLAPGEDSVPHRLGATAPQAARGEVLTRYVVLGFQHILPRGVDHVLFVLGLFLLSTRLGPLLWQVTAFTAAHTLTLALSMTGVVSLPSRLVESLIALSIAYVAIENTLTPKLQPWRPALVFGFGLLHGLGFASVLRELGLPPDEFVTALVGFNLGVEAGQLCVVGLAFVAVGAFRSKSWYRAAIVVPISLVIASIGLFWAVERALGRG